MTLEKIFVDKMSEDVKFVLVKSHVYEITVDEMFVS